MTILKKIITTGLFSLALSTAIFAQAPQKINYQGIGRNSTGAALASQSIGLQITILDGTAPIYTEKHTVTTNAYGLFNVQLGAGSVVSGTFSAIPWSTGNKFVKVEIDPAGGSAYTALGTAELLSVPYALYAGQSAGGPAGPAGPAGPQGAIGLTGPAGATGAQGATGAAGSPGATGSQGATGSTGAQGPAGAQGTQGVAGATGATGATGPANTLTIGTVSNGGSASATITGTAPNQTLNLVLPAGPTGAQGPQGIAGAIGASNTLAIGSVTNGGAASATLSGTAPNQTLNLVLPAGPTGAQGPQGIAGSTGATGPAGATGAAGPQGATGAQGPAGTSGSYTAGTGINITGSVINNTGDLDNANEIQTITLSGSTLSLSLGGGSVTLPSGGGGSLTGSGTANYITKFTGATAIGNSTMQDNGTNIGIGGAPNTADKITIPMTSGTGGLSIAKTNTLANSYSAKFTQSGTNSQTVYTNYNGNLTFPGFFATNPAIAAVASGNGTALSGITLGTNGSVSVLGLSSAWTAGYFLSKDSLSQRASGLVGITNSKRNFSNAIIGYNAGNTADSNHIGVYGSYNTDTTYGTGVMGLGFGGAFPPRESDIGVFGSASNGEGIFGLTNAGYGVYGRAVDTANGWGVYSEGPSYTNGDLYTQGSTFAGGTKSAVIPTSKGNQLVYCSESPEIWFEDFGNGVLKNGAVQINLDALFLETVVIDEKHPMVITVTPMGNCNGLYVEPGTTGFAVKELNNGTSNVKFSYRISAKRAGYENVRFGADPMIAKNIAKAERAKQKKDGKPSKMQERILQQVNITMQK